MIFFVSPAAESRNNPAAKERNNLKIVAGKKNDEYRWETGPGA
jgi:hypothetical protein